LVRGKERANYNHHSDPKGKKKRDQENSQKTEENI